MEAIDIQKILFSKVKQAMPPHVSPVDEIADLLNISNDSAYRRLRGEKQLDLTELQLLARHYHISLDALMNADSNTYVFSGSLIDGEKTGIKEYLQNMLFVVESALHQPDKRFFLEAKDILPLHHFLIPDLAAFKIFFWSKTMIQDDNPGKRFKPEDIPVEMIQLAERISRTYVQIPATEIWNSQTLNTSLRQVDFLWQSGLMESKAQALDIYERMVAMIDHLEAEVTAGEKFVPGSTPLGNPENFHLYHNEVFMGHNTILTVKHDQMQAFINHNVLNFMMTTDETFCRYTYRTFQNLMRKSSLISVTNERERSRFFNNLRRVIEIDKNKL